jgi:hypothetical protein
MKIADVVSALKPLEGHQIGVQRGDILHIGKCAEVRKLEPYERLYKECNVIICTGMTREFAPAGLVFRAADILSVSWNDDGRRVVVEAKSGDYRVVQISAAEPCRCGECVVTNGGRCRVSPNWDYVPGCECYGCREANGWCVASYE